MATEMHLKFITGIALCHAVTETMKQHYDLLSSREKMKGMIDELYTVSFEGLAHFNKKITTADVQAVNQKVAQMQLKGLDDATSYQTYVSLSIATISDIYTELKNARYGNARLNLLEKMTGIMEEMSRYYEQRIRHERNNVEAFRLAENFNEVFVVG